MTFIGGLYLLGSKPQFLIYFSTMYLSQLSSNPDYYYCYRHCAPSCDIVINNNKYTFGLHPSSWLSS